MSRGLINRTLSKLVSNDTQEHQVITSGVDAYKRNGVVTIYIYKAMSISTSYTQLGTLPVGWRPPTTFYAPGYYADASATTMYAVLDTGGIFVRRAAGSGNTQFGTTITFLVA